MHLYFVGDSYVNGYGDDAFLGWPGRACALAAARNYDITCYNLGFRGATTVDLRRWWKDEVQRRVGAEKSAAVVFSFGTNDCTLESGRRRVTRGETAGNARGILGDSAARFPTLMLGPPESAEPERHPDLADTSADLRTICEKLKIPFLDLLDLGKSMTHKRAASKGFDGWHPNAAWYAELAAIVDSWPAWRAVLDKLR
ncbi:MAG: GDSL-type esterase/lipase family protein [Rhodospirillaceae bacterium]|nr:GDSL-type esterase/lipase family protein [Rhodospirillaceae bacterium]